MQSWRRLTNSVKQFKHQNRGNTLWIFFLLGHRQITQVYCTVYPVLLPLRKFGFWISCFGVFEVVLQAEQQAWTAEKSKVSLALQI